MSTDAAFGAIFALVGAVAGTFLSLIPLYLFSVRDAAERNVGLAALLSVEQASLTDYCQSIIDLDLANTDAVFTLTTAPTPAWTAICTAGGFLYELDLQEWLKLSAAYTSLLRLRGILEHYLMYTGTQRALPDYNAGVKYIHAALEKRAEQTLKEFRQLGDVLVQIENRFKQHAKRCLRLIFGTAVLGVTIVFVAAYFAWTALGRGTVEHKPASAQPAPSVKQVGIVSDARRFFVFDLYKCVVYS